MTGVTEAECLSSHRSVVKTIFSVGPPFIQWSSIDGENIKPGKMVRIKQTLINGNIWHLISVSITECFHGFKFGCQCFNFLPHATNLHKTIIDENSYRSINKFAFHLPKVAPPLSTEGKRNMNMKYFNDIMEGSPLEQAN